MIFQAIKRYGARQVLCYLLNLVQSQGGLIKILWYLKPMTLENKSYEKKTTKIITIFTGTAHRNSNSFDRDVSRMFNEDFWEHVIIIDDFINTKTTNIINNSYVRYHH